MDAMIYTHLFFPYIIDQSQVRPNLYCYTTHTLRILFHRRINQIIYD